MPRMIVWADCSDPYPRAGLWYVAEKGELKEAWAITSQAADKGPTAENRADFNWRLVGLTRAARRGKE